jgi:hypothetical protein
MKHISHTYLFRRSSLLPTSHPASALEPRFDDEVCMLSPVHASHDGLDSSLPAEEAGGFALSTPRQGQLAGLRDAVGSRVTLVGFSVSVILNSIQMLHSGNLLDPARPIQ